MGDWNKGFKRNKRHGRQILKFKKKIKKRFEKKIMIKFKKRCLENIKKKN